MIVSHFDRTLGGSVPVIGAVQAIVLDFSTAVANSDTLFKEITFPAGMKFKVIAASVFCGTVTSDPQISIGTTAAGVDIVAAVNLATGANSLTVLDYAPAAAGVIDVRVVADAGDAIALPVTVTLVGWVLAEPTVLSPRTVSGSGF